MGDKIDVTIEDVHHLSNARNNKKQSCIGSAKTSEAKHFKQTTLGSYTNATTTATFTSASSKSRIRKRHANESNLSGDCSSGVNDEEKNALNRMKANTSSFFMKPADSKSIKMQIKTKDLSEMGPTCKKYDLEEFRSFGDLYPNLKSPSSEDFIFIEIESLGRGRIPKPYPNCNSASSREWSRADKFVKLPFAPGNTSYSRIEKALTGISTSLNSYVELEQCLRIICRDRGCNFGNIKHFFNEVLDEDMKTKYLTEVIPFMAQLALLAPSLITQPIPIMRSGVNCSITLSQQQVAVLLSHAFFCTYERARGKLLPAINFKSFFDQRNPTATEKLHCILHYFRCIRESMPTGVISFRRQSKPAPDWKNLRNPLSNFLALSFGKIEDDGFGMLEMDFANKYIGGLVLRKGCVQEEIRFLICPELIVSCLFCERMADNEAIIISGPQRYSNYKGYRQSFKWCPITEKPEIVLRDQFERYLCEVVAIDALSYRSAQMQYEVKNINRELQKAYAGFYAPDGSVKGIATGNWGCGVYRGNPHLKCLLQLIAASANNKPVCYFTFFNRILANELCEMYTVLRDNGITVGQLYQLIVRYCMESHYKSRTLFTCLSEWISERKPVLCSSDG